MGSWFPRVRVYDERVEAWMQEQEAEDSQPEPQAWSRENELEASQVLKLSRPTSSDILPSTRFHHLSLLKLYHQLAQYSSA